MKNWLKNIEKKKPLSDDPTDIEWFNKHLTDIVFTTRTKRRLGYILDWIKGRHERPNPREDQNYDLKTLDIDNQKRIKLFRHYPIQ